MARRWLLRPLACAMVLAVAAISHPPTVTAAPRGQLTSSNPLAAIQDDIDALRLQRAETQLAAYASGAPGDPAVDYFRGVLAFYRGQYETALQRIDAALSAAGEAPRWAQMRALVHSTLQVTRGFVQVASADGRYVVSHAPGKDAILAPYALDVLIRTDRAVEQALGVRLPGPIRLEIFPSARALAEVSALTVEQIETTGTIALSKWDRLMITSPRALVRGYPWADTINHEFIHMVLSRMTAEQAPVWLQEGLAKLMERSWRTGEPGVRLDPGERNLLAAALQDDGLISFDEMHPSIAMLPSQDAAALAFAEVATFMDRYTRTYGLPKLRDALALIEAGTDARQALAKTAGTGFPTLERAWRSALQSDDSITAKNGARMLKRRLKGGEGKTDDSLDVVVEEARRFLRLGDLLWDRGRVKAAAAEYEKAHAADTDDPIVAARFARAALDAGQHVRARDAITGVAERYPDHAPAQAVLGAARLSLGDRAGAATALRAAILVNPFDPQPQCDLARSTSDEAERVRAQNACEQLRAR